MDPDLLYIIIDILACSPVKRRHRGVLILATTFGLQGPVAGTAVEPASCAWMTSHGLGATIFFQGCFRGEASCIFLVGGGGCHG